MKTLVLDLGNTRIKWGHFDNKELVATGFLGYAEEPTEEVKALFEEDFDSLAFATVRGEDNNFLAQAIKNAQQVLHFTSQSEIGVKSEYTTPQTLGADRWANASAAKQLYPDKNVCIIDIGTCIKHDVITSSGVYLGGSIAPGIAMRFTSLAEKTAQLPRLKATTYWPSVGTDTESSIQAGVMHGTLLEIQGRIESITQQFNNPIVVLTGGDAHYFADKLKNSTFAIPNLTLIGIHAAIKYHEK